MKIAIINSSQLNSCWSALQYTESCHLCDKVMTCKVVSDFHKNGITEFVENKRQLFQQEISNKMKIHEYQAEKAMSIFK